MRNHEVTKNHEGTRSSSVQGILRALREPCVFVVSQLQDNAAEELYGRSTRISVPAPSALSMLIVPPSPSMMFFAMGSPRPVPPRFVVKYGSNTCARWAGSMP